MSYQIEPTPRSASTNAKRANMKCGSRFGRAIYWLEAWRAGRSCLAFKVREGDRIRAPFPFSDILSGVKDCCRYPEVPPPHDMSNFRSPDHFARDFSFCCSNLNRRWVDAQSPLGGSALALAVTAYVADDTTGRAPPMPSGTAQLRLELGCKRIHLCPARRSSAGTWVSPARRAAATR